jgi:FkbM family methyltransferase
MNIGLLRSLLIYYGQPQKLIRMLAFYRQFIRAGDLCFDIGAHVGNRLWVWHQLGAQVVALEPQPSCMSILRLLYGRNPAITLLEQAVGSVEGKHQLYVSRRTPAVSSLSPDWIAAVRADPSFAGVRWEAAQPVPVTTLDGLIARFGEPVFCKIDVEGFELEVLKGLSRPLPALSFEYLTPAKEIALGCIARLKALGSYEYNWSAGESHRLGSPGWVSPEAMGTLLDDNSLLNPQGDIFARFSS